jgi:hypothetical protein
VDAMMVLQLLSDHPLSHVSSKDGAALSQGDDEFVLR